MDLTEPIEINIEPNGREAAGVEGVDVVVVTILKGGSGMADGV